MGKKKILLIKQSEGKPRLGNQHFNPARMLIKAIQKKYPTAAGREHVQEVRYWYTRCVDADVRVPGLYTRWLEQQNKGVTGTSSSVNEYD